MNEAERIMKMQRLRSEFICDLPNLDRALDAIGYLRDWSVLTGNMNVTAGVDRFLDFLGVNDEAP